MTGNEAVKAPCPYRITRIISQAMPGGRTSATYTYAPCLGNRCPRWRHVISVDNRCPLCAGVGDVQDCMAEHVIADCRLCPDREGYCE